MNLTKHSPVIQFHHSFAKIQTSLDTLLFKALTRSHDCLDRNVVVTCTCLGWPCFVVSHGCDSCPVKRAVLSDSLEKNDDPVSHSATIVHVKIKGGGGGSRLCTKNKQQQGQLISIRMQTGVTVCTCTLFSLIFPAQTPFFATRTCLTVSQMGESHTR